MVPTQIFGREALEGLRPLVCLLQVLWFTFRLSAMELFEDFDDDVITRSRSRDKPTVHVSYNAKFCEKEVGQFRYCLKCETRALFLIQGYIFWMPIYSIWALSVHH